MASGTDAAAVLPLSTTSLATTTDGGRSTVDTSASVIRALAWCGTNAARSPARTPAASSAPRATRPISVTAHRYTAGPAISRYDQRASAPSRRHDHGRGWAIADPQALSDPHTAGAMPGLAPGPTTTAPAPSPNRNADVR